MLYLYEEFLLIINFFLANEKKYIIEKKNGEKVFQHQKQLQKFCEKDLIILDLGWVVGVHFDDRILSRKS